MRYNPAETCHLRAQLSGTCQYPWNMLIALVDMFVALADMPMTLVGTLMTLVNRVVTPVNILANKFMTCEQVCYNCQHARDTALIHYDR